MIIQRVHTRFDMVVNRSPIFRRDEDGNPGTNIFEKAFPCLYPYGRGGIEADRPVQAHFEDHIKWSLRYLDRRCRRDKLFLFSHVRTSLNGSLDFLTLLRKEKLQLARVEEQQKLPISNPAVRLLRRSAQGVLGLVIGSRSPFSLDYN
ncbi:hypothetical protein BJV78DRAFT_1208804 [Lactifluus subvellereus]|nr:hypothetical protein BJV78DRAFT_1208804 [Lactifluus subvellereus]